MTRFKLSEDHIKLLRHMCVEWDYSETGAPAINPKRPYGNSYVAGDVYKILTGNDGHFLSEEQEDYYLNIHKQTLVALKVFLHNARLTPGDYELLDGWYVKKEESNSTEDSNSPEDYLISEWFDVGAQKVYYSILDGTTKLLLPILPHKIESLDKAKEIVRNLRKYKTSIYHKVY